jgi:hypothetical protein
MISRAAMVQCYWSTLKITSFISIRGVTIWPFNAMDKSSSGKESWIIRLGGLVSMSWSKLMD